MNYIVLVKNNKPKLILRTCFCVRRCQKSCSFSEYRMRRRVAQPPPPWTAEEFPRVEKLHHYFTTANSHVVSTTWHHFHWYYSTLDLSPGGHSHVTHCSGHHKPGTALDLVRNAGVGRVGGLEHSLFLNKLHDFFHFFSHFPISRKH